MAEVTARGRSSRDTKRAKGKRLKSAGKETPNAAPAAGDSSEVLAAPKKRPRGRPRQGRAVARDLPRDEEILKIASEIFYRQGYEGTKLDDIANAAGIMKGSLYHYFDSKEQIYDRVLHNLVGTFSLEEELESPGSPEQHLDHIIAARIKQAATHPLETGILSRQVVRMDGAVGDWARAYRRNHLEVIRALILAGQKTGSFGPGDPNLLAAAVLSFIVGVSDWYRPDGPVPPDELVEQLTAFVMAGLRADDPKKRE